MKKMRAILGSILGILTICQIWLSSSGTEVIGYEYTTIAQGLGALFMLASAVIMVFSLFRIDIGPNGELCYDPDNPYWKAMNWLWRSEWGGEVSLCAAFWLTAVSVLYMVFAAYVLFVIAVLAYAVIWVAPAILFVAAAVKVIIYTRKEIPGAKKFYKAAGYILFFALTSFVLVALPIFDNHQETGSFAGAFWMYFVDAIRVMGIGAGILFGLVLLVILLVKLIPVMQKSWLGVMIKAIKSRTCPILYACPMTAEMEIKKNKA